MSALTAYGSILGVIFAVVMCAAFKMSLDVCPRGWLTWRGCCYVLLPMRMDWYEASKACDRCGSSLAVPDSQEENDFIWREMEAKMKESGAQTQQDFELWIGCTRSATQQLRCSRDEGNRAFINWGSNEPTKNNADECVRMAGKFGGKWGDIVCSQIFFAACEICGLRGMYCLPADANGRFTSHCLVNHTIKNLTANGVIGCGRACLAEPRCHSFNLVQQAGKSNICQLNNATHIEANDATDFKEVDGCSFFEL